jgi:antitoxin component YwqK of YwqJK toxin-antitoxin module
MMVNRLQKKLHKLKFPQLEFPFNGIGVKPQYEVKIFGTKENNLQFYVHEDGSRSRMYSMTAFVKDDHLFLGHYGDYYSWHPDGKLKGIVRTAKGKQHGEQVSWYADGSLSKIWNWHYKKPHGRWMEWYESGVTSFQGHYRYGKKHGKWWEWYENGRMAVKAEFLDGYALDLTVWKPDGTLCSESGVSAGFGYWLSYEDNGELKDRSQISNGEVVYELPDEDEGGEEESES